MSTMNIRDELLALAYGQDESLVPFINEYADLRERFIELTGNAHASEASPLNIDVRLIADADGRREAALIARRMRYLGRFVCSRLRYPS